jgi:hypothetical protein
MGKGVNRRLLHDRAAVTDNSSGHVSGMQVAIFCPFVHWPTHFATDLELVQRHLDDEDRVTILVCDGELPSCDVNLPHVLERCASCIERRTVGLQLLSRPVTVEPLFRYLPKGVTDLVIPRFTDHQGVKAFRVNGFDLGSAALSSLIFHTRDADCDLDANAQLLSNLMQTAYLVYASTDAYLGRHTVDRFYVYNTRFASTRGVMRACASNGVECVVHERGCDLSHFELYPNAFPHDRAITNRDISELWTRAPDAERREVGARWYRDKSVAIETYARSFVADQQDGLLPSNWDGARRNLVIFTSSEDEFAAIGDEWENPIYRNELEGVGEIVRSLSGAGDDLHIYVRMHPNLRGLSNRQTRGLMALDAPHVTVVPPESPVSTYALLRHAWKVVTFGSTVGIEAAFWGVPSILAGISFYRDLGGTYNPATHAELIEMIRADLPPKDQTPALMYGYFSARFGKPFRYYRATSYDDGEFKGVNVWRPAEPNVR